MYVYIDVIVKHIRSTQLDLTRLSDRASHHVGVCVLLGRSDAADTVLSSVPQGAIAAAVRQPADTL